MHPGANRTEATIVQHFYLTNMQKTVKQVCSICELCQKTKCQTIKYGKLPAKVAEVIP